MHEPAKRVISSNYYFSGPWNTVSEKVRGPIRFSNACSPVLSHSSWYLLIHCVRFDIFTLDRLVEYQVLYSRRNGRHYFVLPCAAVTWALLLLFF